MLRLVGMVILAALLPARASAQVTLTTRPVADTLAVWLLNSAVPVPIEGVADSPYLIPRLYGVADEGGCVEDTHMICSHRYFLAISEDGTAPAQALFDLGEVGQIVRAQVVSGKRPDQPLLRVTVLNYPEGVFSYAPKLRRQVRVYAIALDLRGLRITPEP